MPARAGDDALEDGQVTVEQRGKASLEIREVRRVEHDAVLDHFGEPRAVLALGQGREGRGIDHHQPGLVERADQVLGARVVDGGLAAARGIHLGEQRGGDLDEIDPPHVGRRGEAREIAHGATSHGHDRRGAVTARLQEVIPDLAEDVERLGLLALGQQHLRHFEAGRDEAPRHRFAVQPPDGRVGQERDAPPHGELGKLSPDVGARPHRDDDPVRARGQIDGDLDHGVQLTAFGAAPRVPPATSGS